MVAWLHWNRNEGCTYEAMDRAAQNGHLKVVQFLHTHRREGTFIYIYISILRLDILLALLLFTRPMNRCVLYIVYCNHNHTLMDGVAIFLGCTHLAIDRAAGNGYLATVQWLVENRDEGFTEAALEQAEQYGYHNVTQYLLSLYG